MKKGTHGLSWLVSFFLLLTSPSALAEWTLSRTYVEVQTFMRSLASQYPNHAKVISIGTNDSGLAIEALEIGSGPVENLVVATHHGNEYGSTEVAKGLAQDLAQAPLSGQRIVVIPVLNISGFNARSRNENGRDPNRDYPGPCGTDGPFRLKSTKALADFMASRKFLASATLHTYSEMVVYPWGISTRDLSTPYDTKFKDLCDAAAQDSGYQTGNNTELLYAADGTFEDYAFWKHGVWSLLFEMGTTHRPSLAQVKEMIRVNVPGIRRFFSQAPAQLAEKHEFTGKCDTKRRIRPHLE